MLALDTRLCLGWGSNTEGQLGDDTVVNKDTLAGKGCRLRVSRIYAIAAGYQKGWMRTAMSGWGVNQPDIRQ
jgi:alpha-tubulin suppressor-like RCC1 family protein